MRTIRSGGVVRVGIGAVLGLSISISISASAVEGVDLVWADRPGDTADAAFAQVEMRSNRVVARLHSDTPDGAPGIRAYDKDSGRLLWSYRSWTEGGPMTFPERQVALATSESRVYTVGFTPADDREGVLNRSITTRAMAMADGERLWANVTVFLGATGLKITDMTRFGPRLFLGGSLSGRGYVRVEDARGGGRLWEHHPELDDAESTERVDRVHFSSRRLTTAGVRTSGDGGTNALVLRRYNAVRGRLQWERIHDDGRSIRPLVLTSGSLVGQWAPSPTETPRWFVLAFSTFDGEVRWEDTAFPNARSAAVASTFVDGKMIVVGWVERGRRRPVVRAYAPSTGELLWQRVGAGVRRGAYTSTVADFVSRTIVVAGSGRKPGQPGDRALLQSFDSDGALLWSRFGAAGDGGGEIGAIDRRNAQVAAGGRLLMDDGRSQPFVQFYDLAGSIRSPAIAR